MSTKLRIVLAQLNLFVGDISYNLTKLMDAAKLARDSLAADVIVFPELSITGYPPEDLLFRKAFLDEATEALYEFKNNVEGIYCVIGHPYKTGDGLHNACSVIYDGEILGTYLKQHLPNYSVFDECRYFVPGEKNCVISIKGIPVGITICEDLWYDAPIQRAAEEGARIILSPNASPFEVEKHEHRQITLAKRAKTVGLPIVYVNNIGGQDELIFDGGSMLVDQEGKICQHAGFFTEALLPVDVEFTPTETSLKCQPIVIPSKEQRIYQALVLGVHDYIHKNHFKGALIGLSGGIDSALALAIAVDALGKDNVTAVLMPSRYTSDMSNEDAIQLAHNLGVQYETISIEPVFESFLQTLAPVFAGKKPDVTEENLQARCRGMILMAISNKTGRIVLTTSNRSESAVGYATLYGDMAGGFCVLKDVPKSLIYQLADYRNMVNSVIPQRIIDRPPSAELAANQKDEDTLPAYSVLDAILELYLNQELSIDDIVAKDFPRATVEKVVQMIHKSEYKRRQAPVGTRIDDKSFGKDWRYPIASGFKK